MAAKDDKKEIAAVPAEQMYKNISGVSQVIQKNGASSTVHVWPGDTVMLSAEDAGRLPATWLELVKPDKADAKAE